MVKRNKNKAPQGTNAKCDINQSPPMKRTRESTRGGKRERKKTTRTTQEETLPKTSRKRERRKQPRQPCQTPKAKQQGKTTKSTRIRHTQKDTHQYGKWTKDTKYSQPKPRLSERKRNATGNHKKSGEKQNTSSSNTRNTHRQGPQLYDRQL